MTRQSRETPASRPSGVAVNHTLLTIYLNDHLAGATIGTHRMRRLANAERSSAEGAELGRIASEIEEDAATLIELMRRLDITTQRYKRAAAWLTERLGVIKLNGSFLSRSPLTTLVELEMMQTAVTGKNALWHTLLHVGLIPQPELLLLIARTRRQKESLEQIHQRRSTFALNV